MTLLEAIAREEGYYVPGSRAARNNNPGNVEAGRFAVAHGAIGSDGRFAHFPSPLVGYACMSALFGSGYRGMTLQGAISRWAPSSENDVASYVRNVCTWTGLTPDTVIDPYIGVSTLDTII